MVGGTVVANRFVIEWVAGRGGMSTVYRALDQRLGRPVALKLLHRAGQATHSSKRMVLEAQMLAELRHPGIVSYIAHGHTASGLPFLAMEWLDGEDLAGRLSHRPLSVRETITLLQGVTEALAAAHRHGIIHRDIKPSNLFLRQGKVENVTLLDFGVARRLERASGVTATGAIVGTPEYMAPEQARGQTDITAATDMFSLGCVLFRCLTGELPYRAAHLSALLAKLLFDDVPPIRQRRPDIPSSLATLVDWMLAKTPEDRPQDGTVLLAELSRLSKVSWNDRPPEPEAPPSARQLFLHEEQLVSVVMASPPGSQLPDGRTLEPTDLSSDERSYRTELQERLGKLGAHVEFLVDDSIIAFLAGEQAAVDLAVQATRCALLIKEKRPSSLVAVATGCAQIQERRPIGEAIDRVVEFINIQECLTLKDESPKPRHVMLDGITAGLVRSHFACIRSGPGLFILEPTIPLPDEVRLLLGKRSPMIGRQRELVLVETALHESAHDSISRAVLLTAESGMGKTRLRHEILRRLPKFHPDAIVLLGLASSLESENPCGLIGQFLRRFCGGEEWATRSGIPAELLMRLGRHVPPGQQQFTVDTLSRLCELSPEDGRSTAAPSGDGLIPEPGARALLTFLTAECAQHPVVIVLEDLQWADAATVRLIGLALRELAGQPLFVLALARSDVRRRFPRLWSDRRPLEIHLDRLSRASSIELARAVLDPGVPMQTIQHITELAGSNPLHLEELIRWVADGKEAEPPGTLMAMLHGQMMMLPAEERRLLRAASVFGKSFSLSALLCLLDTDATPQESERWLQSLIEMEILVRDRHHSADHMNAFRFRDTMMQEAAYRLLSGSDRVIGHRLAGAFLEGTGGEQGEERLWTLAHHAERGDQFDRAVGFWLEAAEQAVSRRDFPRALEACKRALRCAMGSEQQRAVLALEHHVQTLRDEQVRLAQSASSGGL